jgi:toxin ParE1/3/4
MRITWTSPARRELDAIGEFIGRHNKAAADRVVTCVLDQVEQLTDLPYIGRPGRVEGTRELVITTTPYIVPYRVRDHQIEVLSVIHGARKWPDRFN